MTIGHSNLIDIASDNHIHTRFCRHASGTMEDYVKSAVEKGLREINFLEHMEIGIHYFERVWLTDDDFDNYFHEGQYLQKKYRHQLVIGIGVEVGYNPDYKNELIDKLRSRPWDRIGLSCHFTKAGQLPHHLNLVSRKKNNVDAFTEMGCDKLLERYFSDLYDAVDTLPADFVCHLDAALRHHPDRQLSKSHYQQIAKILHRIKQKKMALEINTSGFAIRGEPFPCEEIVKMALDDNISFVAGSDAHKPEDVGRFFSQLPGFLEKCISLN